MRIIRFFIGIATFVGVFALTSELQLRALNYVLFQVKKAALSRIAKGLVSLEDLSNNLTGTRSELLHGTQAKKTPRKKSGSQKTK